MTKLTKPTDDVVASSPYLDWPTRGLDEYAAELRLRLDDVLVEDILAASDEAILAETKQAGEDPEAVAAVMLALFEKVVAARP